MRFNQIMQKFSGNELVREIIDALGLVSEYKHHARSYYFDVLFSIYRCPSCGGKLKMTEENLCTCCCGNVLDPTLTFQKSPCCGVELIRKTFHYDCSMCRKTVPSRFLFDERIFDKTYFRDMMRESRGRKKIKREEIRRLLVESRSDTLIFTDSPDFEKLPGLVDDLGTFIQSTTIESTQNNYSTECLFDMYKYRDHILSALSWDRTLFSELDPLYPNCQEDRAYRFITLVYMDHEQEVELNQCGDDLSIQRRYNEAYA